MRTQSWLKKQLYILAMALGLGLGVWVSSGWAASVIGTNASVFLTNQTSSQWLPLWSNQPGWEVIYQPTWIEIFPQPTETTSSDSTTSVLPPLSKILITLDPALKSGTYEDRLVLRDVGTGQFWEAMVTAHVEESEEATEAARLILFTNTARSIDLNLDINTGRSGKYFVLIEHPQLLPGQVYAYVPQGKLVPFSSYGFPAPNAGDLFLAEDVDNISIRLGQVNLVGLEGSLKVHVDRSTTTDLVPVQEIFYNIDSLSGDWLISDTFKGVAYPEYSAVLHEGFGLFSGTWWDGCNATVHYSPEGWYVVEFYDQYFSYRYEVRAIGTDTLSGFWSYSGAPDKQYPFTGRKKGNLFPISPQINGKWIFSSEEESCCCPFLPGIFEGQVTMAKTGDQVSLSMDAGDLKGTIEGNEMRLSGVWFLDDGYTLSIRASATLTEDGAMLYGTSCWILSSYELSCEGTSIFRGSR